MQSGWIYPGGKKGRKADQGKEGKGSKSSKFTSPYGGAPLGYGKFSALAEESDCESEQEIEPFIHSEGVADIVMSVPPRVVRRQSWMDICAVSNGSELEGLMWDMFQKLQEGQVDIERKNSETSAEWAAKTQDQLHSSPFVGF